MVVKPDRPIARMTHTLETVGQNLDEARAKIEATREMLQADLDAQDSPDGELAALFARPERMVSEVARIEKRLALTSSADILIAFS